MKKLYFLSISVLSMAFSGISQITDPSFETGPTGTAWTQASTNFGTPLCDAAGCGTCGGPCVPRTGSFYSWYGGAGGALETASVEQSVVIPNGTTGAIKLWVKIATAGPGIAGDKLDVSLDGNILATVTALDSVAYVDYAQLTVDVSSMTDGNAHTLRIEGFQSTTTVFNILVDDVEMTVDGNTIGLFEFETGENEVIIFPNPAKEIINLQFRNVSGDVDVQIVDLAGKVVSNQKVVATYASAYVLNTTDLNNGSYIMTVTQNGNVLRTENIVINK
jgi:hypothetical protein